MSTAGVLLAAGAGTRFSGPSHKLLAELDGRTVFDRALSSLVEAALDETAVVRGAADVSGTLAARRVDIVELVNERWRCGIASSVRCAAFWAARQGHDAIVVGLADQPFVASSAWRAVAAGAGPITVAAYHGRRGNPVRLAKEVWPLLPWRGDEGARALIRRLPEIVLPLACQGLPDDIDTMEDLRRWS
ncbi:nucleotidyltransferase family protein [Candidatus Poriferisodalis sp.]|uniref:nucleotidyltransferase family protein n=1 Tax=Candidatus Poriferisodalis sp. TaxID=3101277 RepID=UPI003B0206E8